MLLVFNFVILVVVFFFVSLSVTPIRFGFIGGASSSISSSHGALRSLVRLLSSSSSSSELPGVVLSSIFRPTLEEAELEAARWGVEKAFDQVFYLKTLTILSSDPLNRMHRF